MIDEAPGLTGQQCHSTVDDETLKQVKLYIDRFAQTYISATFTAEDVEDLVQNSWVKFWISSPQGVISLKSYVRQLVYHEFVSMLRKQRKFWSLKTTEDGEYLYPQDAVLIEPGEEMGDPQEVLQRRCDYEERVGQVMGVVRELSPRQQFAMRCWLYQRVDNLVALIDAFSNYQIHGEMLWPASRLEKQRLLASCAPAKVKIAQHLKLDIHQC
jgi:DNA-directed RNA polymerase specialized sigma24 family protein